MNNTKILVLTQQNKWYNNISARYDEHIDIEQWKNDYPIDSVPVKKCDFIDGKAVLCEIDLNNFANEEGVFLVYDSITNPEVLELLKEQCKGCELYLLIHRNGNLQKNDFNDWNVKEFREGSHTYQLSDYYVTVFNILTDKEPDKLERIIDKVFAPNLEIVLRFLNHCLVPDSEREYAELKATLLERLPNDSEAKKALDNFPKQTKLEELRDQLLNFALTPNQSSRESKE